jgi:lipocalin
VQVAWPATSFEVGGSHGLEQYTWDEKKQQVKVAYTMQRKGKETAEVLVRQRGGVRKENPNGTTWWVQPKIGPLYLPFKLGYMVIGAQEDSYLVASSPSTTGLGAWCYIMTRDKQVTDAFLEPLKKTAVDAGWDPAKAERMVQ